MNEDEEKVAPAADDASDDPEATAEALAAKMIEWASDRQMAFAVPGDEIGVGMTTSHQFPYEKRRILAPGSINIPMAGLLDFARAVLWFLADGDTESEPAT